MLKGKYISIVSSGNFLLCLGIKSILTDFFSPERTEIFPGFEEYVKQDTGNQPDFIVLHSELYVLHNDYFQAHKNKLIVLTGNESSGIAQQSVPATLNTSLSQDEIVDRLEKIFRSRTMNNTTDQEDLSIREIEVLKLVAVGMMNKQIADHLNISLHTVISHRKNITRKLGIKTVSGLTVYALLNGIISSAELG